MRKTNIVRLLPDTATAVILSVIGDRVSALWNAANYICRQAFIKGENVPTAYSLCTLMKETPDYKALPTHIGQETLKKVGKAWVSFFRLRREHAAGKLKDKPGMPRYRKDRRKDSRPWDYIPVKSNLAYKVEGNTIYLAVPGDLNGLRIAIPFKGIIRYKGKFKTCELLYDSVKRGWYAHLVVEVRDIQRPENPIRHAAGDIGARRTITVSIESSRQSDVYSSRMMWKDYKYWTRRVAQEKSSLASQGLKTSRRLQGYYRMRRLRLKHAMETLAGSMFRTLRRIGITHFTVGYPVNCRDNARFGKTNELVHNFWSYELLLRILERHAIRQGIHFKRVGERGTSSRCHICGKKLSRPRTDTVICKSHGRMHADVNGSRNILFRETRTSVRDGVQATPGWTVWRWDNHCWLSHAQSASNRVQRADAQAAA